MNLKTFQNSLRKEKKRFCFFVFSFFPFGSLTTSRDREKRLGVGRQKRPLFRFILFFLFTFSTVCRGRGFQLFVLYEPPVPSNQTYGATVSFRNLRQCASPWYLTPLLLQKQQKQNKNHLQLVFTICKTQPCSVFRVKAFLASFVASLILLYYTFDWLKSFGPRFKPIKCNFKITRDLSASVFLRFSTET